MVILRPRCFPASPGCNARTSAPAHRVVAGLVAELVTFTVSPMRSFRPYFFASVSRSAIMRPTPLSLEDSRSTSSANLMLHARLRTPAATVADCTAHSRLSRSMNSSRTFCFSSADQRVPCSTASKVFSKSTMPTHKWAL
eukprot:1300598-Pyramimonas_sp.AAC.1